MGGTPAGTPESLRITGARCTRCRGCRTAGDGSPVRELQAANARGRRTLEGGGGGNGYNQINHAGLRADPITRLFLRHQAFEKEGATVRTHTGRQITCGEVNKAALYEDADALGSGQTQGDAESLRALVDVCLPVHYSVHFTHAAAVDGSMDDPRQRGGEGRKRVAYGVYEGIQPAARVATTDQSWDSQTRGGYLRIGTTTTLKPMQYCATCNQWLRHQQRRETNESWY